MSQYYNTVTVPIMPEAERYGKKNTTEILSISLLVT